jgi:hypothetical protein
MSTDTVFDGVGRPTRTSTAITAVVTAVVVFLLLGEVDLVVWPAIIGSVGSAAIAVSLYLVSLERVETVASVIASVLTVVVAVGLIVGTFGTVLILVGAFFPAESLAAVSIRSLLLISRAGIVVGCMLAVLGVLLGLRNVIDKPTLSSYFWLAVKTSLVPGVVGTAMVVSAYLTRGGSEPPALLATLPATISQWVLSPAPVRPHLATFTLLVAVGGLSVRAAVGALPVAELLADSGGGETQEEQVAQVRSALLWVGGGALLLTPVVFMTELVFGPSGLRQLLGAGLYRPLVTLSTAPGLRILLVAATLVAVPTVAAVRLLQRAVQGSVTGFVSRVGPFVGGALVTVGAITVARPVFDGLVGWVAARLPGPFAPAFSESSSLFADFFGASAIVVLLAAVLVGVTAAFVLLLRFAVFAGYLASDTAGYSLAAGGLFVATAFAGTVGASPWLVFGGLVGTFLIWDSGRYGTTLGDEIGRAAPTRDAELVHAGGTLAVGLLGTGLAYGVSTFISGGLASGSTAVVALMGVLVGIVFLVAALR